MAAKSDRKDEAERSALRIARKLAVIKPDDLSERQWCDKAGVSPSFFSNLRGTPSKPPSDPGIDKLRSVLSVANITLAEFFADEARGKVAMVPTKQELAAVLGDALPGRPRQEDRLAEYLAETVIDILALPPTKRATLRDRAAA